MISDIGCFFNSSKRLLVNKSYSFGLLEVESRPTMIKLQCTSDIYSGHLGPPLSGHYIRLTTIYPT